MSPSSGKFHLLRGSQLGPARSHLPAPALTVIESKSETEIVIHWTFPNHLTHPVEGFYVYYRASTTAGEYSKATVEGMAVRSFEIDHLESGTSYEFKIQSFTSSAASDFSAILTGRTLSKHLDRKTLENILIFQIVLEPIQPTVVPSVVVAPEASQRQSSILPLIVGAAGGITMLFLLFIIVFIALKKRKLARDGKTNFSLISWVSH